MKQSYAKQLYFPQRSETYSLRAHHPGSHLSGSSAADLALMRISDALMILVSYGFAIVLGSSLTTRTLAGANTLFQVWDLSTNVFFLGLFVLVFLLVASRYGLYSPVPIGGVAHEMRLITQSCLTAGLVLCGALYMFPSIRISRMLVMLQVITASGTLCIRYAMRIYFRYRQYELGIELRNVVIVGTNRLSYALSQHIQNNYRLGYRFVGFVAVSGSEITPEISKDRILGGAEKLREFTRLNFVDEVVITEFYPIEDAIQLVEEARELNVDVRTVPGYYDDLTQNAPIEYLGIFPVASIHRCKPRTIAMVFKRTVDIIFSLAALLIASPLMLSIALAVKLDSEGPAFYVSDRIGKRGRVFPCFKFRTMVKDAEKKKRALAAKNERDGILFKLTNDPRVTRIGRVLRKYSFDELPQLLNVLRGEMSLVGPRPPIASEVEKYELEHFRRLEVLPGLTGLWQVQSRQDSSFSKYIALDTAYVENWSPWLDLKILVRTAGVVVRGTGV